MMRPIVQKSLVYLLSCAILCIGVPAKSQGTQLVRGDDTAADAAAPNLGSRLPPAFYSFAFADTSTYEFPDEEEETQNIVKDIVIWTAAAAFVAFFIIKVFLEGDEDTPSDSPPGKTTPGPFSSRQSATSP